MAYSTPSPFRFTDTPEKQRVRKELWIPLFQKLKLTRKKIKYLTLPGPGCFELSLLLENGLIDLKYVISIEKEERFMDEIKAFYAQNGIVGGEVYELVHNIPISNICQNTTIKRKFPFDIINLDAYGSPLDTSKDNESEIFDLITKIMNIQSPLPKEEFYIIVNSKILGARKKREVERILTELEGETQLPEMREVLESDATDKEIFSLILYPIFLSCDRIKITELISVPYTYIGTGHSSRMVSFILKVTVRKRGPVSPRYYERAKMEAVKRGITNIKSMIRIN